MPTPIKYATDGERKRAKAEASRLYRKNNPDKARAATAAWRAKNKDKMSELKRAWDKKNGDRIKATKALWRAANRKRERERCRRWQKENREKARSASSAWKDANPEVQLLAASRRRAVKKKSRGVLSKDIIRKLRKLQKGKCAACKADFKKTGYHLDHIVPLVPRGNEPKGRHEDANMQLLCPECNQRKHNKNPIQFMQEMGYLL